MHSNKVWKLVLGIFLLVTLYFGANALYKVYEYQRYDQSTAAELLRTWTASKKGGFSVWAAYRYRVDGKEYEAKALLSPEEYRNAYSGESWRKQLSQRNWTVWFQEKHPQNSVLLKAFPWKPLLYFFVLLLLLVYFIWLGFYVGRMHKGEKQTSV